MDSTSVQMCVFTLEGLCDELPVVVTHSDICIWMPFFWDLKYIPGEGTLTFCFGLWS